MSTAPNIIDKLKETAHSIVKSDLDWIVPELIEFYSPKLKSLSYYAYGSSVVALPAFKELAKAEIRKSVETFMFSSQHWRSGRDINTYLLTCLNRMADRLKFNSDGQKKLNVPVCPGCKFIGEKSYLRYEGKLLRCTECYNASLALGDDKHPTGKTQADLRLRQIFSLHSRKGLRCPECERFIPDSYLRQYGVSCPYSDCCFFGTKNELEPMGHPLGLSSDIAFSLNESYWNKGYNPSVKYQNAPANSSYQDVLRSRDAEPDLQIETIQEYEKEFKIMNDVVAQQIESLNRNEPQAILKRLMYASYQNMISKSPDDMISYLVHLKHVPSNPIQSRIFQEFVRLVENALPFTITKGGKQLEVCSLLDPNLGIFTGMSQFHAVVDERGLIPNNTIETYVGGRKLKDFGPCFIGYLVDVTDDSGQSLMDSVKNYTFVQINTNIDPGTKVNVKHFRILSHYEVGVGMIVLQRSRLRIVNRIYYKLHGVKRPLKGSQHDRD